VQSHNTQRCSQQHATTTATVIQTRTCMLGTLTIQAGTRILSTTTDSRHNCTSSYRHTRTVLAVPPPNTLVVYHTATNERVLQTSHWRTSRDWKGHTDTHHWRGSLSEQEDVTLHSSYASYKLDEYTKTGVHSRHLHRDSHHR